MVKPDNPFNQRKILLLIMSRNLPTMVLSKTHQQADPRKTPKINSRGDINDPAEEINPIPVNIAAKERMVTGLVRVRTNVLRKIPEYEAEARFGG